MEIRKCTYDTEEETLARAEDEYGIEHVSMVRIHVLSKAWYIDSLWLYKIEKKVMDGDGWMEIFTSFNKALPKLKEELLRKDTYDGGKVYKTVELSETFYEELDEMENARYSEKEYGPSNPWDAPGMKVSDFIRGVSFC